MCVWLNNCSVYMCVCVQMNCFAVLHVYMNVFCVIELLICLYGRNRCMSICLYRFSFYCAWYICLYICVCVWCLLYLFYKYLYVCYMCVIYISFNSWNVYICVRVRCLLYLCNKYLYVCVYGLLVVVWFYAMISVDFSTFFLFFESCHAICCLFRGFPYVLFLILNLVCVITARFQFLELPC